MTTMTTENETATPVEAEAATEATHTEPQDTRPNANRVPAGSIPLHPAVLDMEPFTTAESNRYAMATVRVFSRGDEYIAEATNGKLAVRCIWPKHWDDPDCDVKLDGKGLKAAKLIGTATKDRGIYITPPSPGQPAMLTAWGSVRGAPATEPFAVKTCEDAFPPIDDVIPNYKDDDEAPAHVWGFGAELMCDICTWFAKHVDEELCGIRWRHRKGREPVRIDAFATDNASLLAVLMPVTIEENRKPRGSKSKKAKK
jgi:hypothetical protein